MTKALSQFREQHDITSQHGPEDKKVANVKNKQVKQPEYSDQAKQQLPEQHADEGKFKPVKPKMIQNTPIVSPRATNDSANVKLKEDEMKLEEEIAGWIAHYNGQKHEIKKHEAKDLYDAKQKAIAHFKAPKSKHGLIAVKPAYNEAVEEGAFKRIATDAEEDKRLGSWKKETPWMPSKGTVTDKSGAKHTPMSRARDLARAAAKKNVKESVSIAESRLADIVREAAESAKKKKKEEKAQASDKFQADPELTTQIIKND